MAALRICPRCGAANDPDATFCGACATQMVVTSTALVHVPRKSALPVLSQREKATLGGVALSLAAIALRVGTQLLKQASRPQPAPLSPSRPAHEGSPDLIIRRRWVINDGNNPPQWGEEEIEIHRPSDSAPPYRLWLK